MDNPYNKKTLGSLPRNVFLDRMVYCLVAESIFGGCTSMPFNIKQNIIDLCKIIVKMHTHKNGHQGGTNKCKITRPGGRKHFLSLGAIILQIFAEKQLPL